MNHAAIILSGSTETIIRIKRGFLNLLDDCPKLFGVFNKLCFMTECSLGVTIRRPHIKIDILLKGIIKMDQFAGRVVNDACGEENVMLLERLRFLNFNRPEFIEDCQQKLVTHLKRGLKQFDHLFKVLS